jgi:hypothetical protein
MRTAYVGLALAKASVMIFTISAIGCGGNGGGNGAKGGSGGSSSAGGAPGTGGISGSGGRSGGAGGGTSITGLGGDKPIGSLAPSDAAQLCKDAYAYFAKAVSQADLCKWAGLSYGISSSPVSDSALQQNCKTQESSCLTADPPIADCSAIPAMCAATVSQYSACIIDQAAAFNAAVAALPGCTTVTRPDLQGVWDYATGDLPASCTAITDKCPAMDLPTPRPGTSGSGSGGGGGTAGSGGSGGSSGTGGAAGNGGNTRAGGASGGGGTKGSGGAPGSGGTAGSGGAGGSGGGAGGNTGTGGSGGSTSGLPGDVAKAAGTPMVAAHSMTRALFASYTGPLFQALRLSDNQLKDIGIVAATGLADLSTLNTFCAGTSCKVTTLYDQAGNGNDMWRADDPTKNQPGTNKPCDLLDIQYWQMSDGTNVPVAVEYADSMWRNKGQCLRNRDKTKNMPTGAKPQTTYAIFHGKRVNGGCCFNYGNTNNAIAYSGPGTLTALNFSTMTFWSKGTGNGPWPMVDFETGVYTGNTGKCGSGIPSTVDCTNTGENANPSVTFDLVTTFFKHNGVDHWALKTGNAKAGALSVNVDLSALPKGYSPLKQLGGLGLGEGGAGDCGGNGGFSEGAVMAGETTNATDDAIQKSVVSVYGK